MVYIRRVITTNDVIEFVVKLLKDMDKKEFEAKKFVSYKDRFQSFLIGALFFLIIDLLLFEKNKMASKVKFI